MIPLNEGKIEYATLKLWEEWAREDFCKVLCLTRSISRGHDMQALFFDKTYHPILRDSAYCILKVHHRVHFFKVYSFVTVPPTVPLNNRTKVKHGTLELKTHEKFI